MRKLVSLMAVAALTAALVLSAVAFGATKKVGVKGFKFTPKTLRVKKGTTVVWHWSGSVPHQLAGKGFSSGGPKPRVTYKHKFKKAGKYTYVCKIHKALGMKGVIIVS